MRKILYAVTIFVKHKYEQKKRKKGKKAKEEKIVLKISKAAVLPVKLKQTLVSETKFLRIEPNSKRRKENQSVIPSKLCTFHFSD